MRAKACVKAFLLACLAFSAHAAEYTGYLKSLIVDNGEGASEERLYYLEHVSKGTWLRLQLASELEDRFSTIRTGEVVSVEGQLSPDDFTVLLVSALNSHVEAQYVAGEFVSAVGPTGAGGVSESPAFNITSITFVVSDIGQYSQYINMDVFRATWLNGYGEPQNGRTMQDYHRLCSFGKVAFLPENNVVVGPIRIPATGTGRAGPWSVAQCNGQAYWGWFDYAYQIVQQQYPNINLSKYSRRIMIMPDVPTCGWAGLGSVGCASTCNTWVKGAYAYSLDTPFHELGHNLGLQHSSSPGSEYGDCSCAMGGCSSLRCFNAPQSWKLGWYTLVADLNKDNMVAGRWQQYELPATQRSPRNTVRATANWQPPYDYTSYFFSYREPLNGDEGLSPRYWNRVAVHMYKGVQGKIDGEMPMILAAVDVGQEWADGARMARMRMRVVRKTEAGVLIEVCRVVSLLGEECGGSVAMPLPPEAPEPSPPPRKRPPPPPRSAGIKPPPSSKPRPPPRRPAAPPKPPKTPPPPKLKPPQRPKLFKPPPKPRPSPRPPSAPAPACPTLPPPRCGDGVCDGWANEDCRSCPQDCKGDQRPRLGPGQWCCGANRTGCGHPECGQCRERCPKDKPPPRAPRSPPPPGADPAPTAAPPQAPMPPAK